MTLITAPEQFNTEELYVDLHPIFGHSLYLKCEGFNFAGSVKLKAAAEMVEAAEREGALGPDSVIVESSSGNLGVALSMIAASKGYRFLCVTDSRCNLVTRQTMEALGSEVHVIVDPDPVEGFLGARLDHVQGLCDSDARYVWLNQYSNPNSWKAHYHLTAPAIARRFPNLEVLFVGAGTTGTLMGCARYFRARMPSVRIVAVDAVGSVTFGGAPARRLIPGLGTGVRPALLDESFVDEVVLVEEADTIRACRRLARRGVPVRRFDRDGGQWRHALAGRARPGRTGRGGTGAGSRRALPGHDLPRRVGARSLRRLGARVRRPRAG